MKVTIFEEVPGCEPHWYVAIPSCGSDQPKFDTLEGAMNFCRVMRLEYTVEYFES